MKGRTRKRERYLSFGVSQIAAVVKRARLKPEARNSFGVSNVGGRGEALGSSFAAFPDL